MLDPKVKELIEKDISENKVMLYMKGNKEEPMCGFSAQVINILNGLGVDYMTADILQNWDLREGIKEYSSWPTIPQLYVDGKFVGGCDIVMELQRKGELAAIVSA